MPNTPNAATAPDNVKHQLSKTPTPESKPHSRESKTEVSGLAYGIPGSLQIDEVQALDPLAMEMLEEAHSVVERGGRVWALDGR